MTIDEDRKLADDRRFILVGSEHVTGAGGWGDVLVLGCREGKVAVLFHAGVRFGVNVEEASADKLVLKSGKWLRSDPDCCPSMEERQVYQWDDKRQTYLLDSDTSTPLPKP